MEKRIKMIKKIIGAVLVLGSLLLVGCATPKLTPQQISKIDFGKKPKVDVSKMRDVLVLYKDPESVRIKLTDVPLRKGYSTDKHGNLIWKGWIATVKTNAKNSYGAYTGYKVKYIALRSDGTAHLEDNEGWLRLVDK